MLRGRRLSGALIGFGLVAGIGLAVAVLAGRGSPAPPRTSSASPSSPGIAGVLHAVACSSHDSCVAVGSYRVQHGRDARRSLVEVWNGRSWSEVRAPSPGADAELRSVACPSPTYCVAVGSSGAADDPRSQQALLESWDGSSWSVAPIPNPGTPSSLQGVVCTSSTSCTAVGWWSNSDGRESALVESSNKGAWRVVPTPSAPGFATWLASIACPSPSWCVAVGSYNSSDGDDPGPRTLVESWNGASWSVVPSPSPGRELSVLNAVACSAPTACIAAGAVDDGDVYIADRQGLVETWDGAAWAVVPSPAGGGGIQNVLQAIACTSPVSCVAVGATTPPSEGERTLVERWDGAAWAVASGPSTVGGLESVVCVAATSCLASGRQSASANPSQQTFAEWLPG